MLGLLMSASSGEKKESVKGALGDNSSRWHLSNAMGQKTVGAIKSRNPHNIYVGKNNLKLALHLI